MKQLREKGPASSITLDSGNLLFKRQRIQHSQEALNALGLMDIYTLMGYDAVAVGPVDLAGGIELLKRGSEQGFPWLSANILDENNAPVFPAVKILERGSLRIGVVAVSGAPAPAPQGMKFADWRTELPAHLESLAGQCELLIVLSSLEMRENTELLQLFPQIHILITANEQQGNIAPRITGGTLVTQTSPQGKHLGVLNINWLPGQGWGKDFSQEQILLGEQLSILNRRILRIQRNSMQQGTNVDQALQQLEQEKQRILEKMRQTEKEQQNTDEKQSAASSYDGSFISLTTNLPEDHDIAKAIDALKEKIIAEQDKSAKNSFSPGSSTSKVYPGIVGSSRCAECHPLQTEFWRKTGHAQAYATLQGQNQHFNLDCLPCHVTHTTENPGTGTPIPLETMLSLPENLRAVGCEMCHGPGKGHALNPENVPPEAPVGQQTCNTCHTAEHDTDFVYQQKISAISCPAN